MHVLVQSNPDVQDWMQANSLGSLSQLEGYFESRVLDLATLAGRSYIVWQVRTLLPDPYLMQYTQECADLPLRCPYDSSLVMMLVVMSQVVTQVVGPPA